MDLTANRWPVGYLLYSNFTCITKQKNEFTFLLLIVIKISLSHLQINIQNFSEYVSPLSIFIDEDNVYHCNFSIFIDGEVTYQNEEIISGPHCPGSGWLHISAGNIALPVIPESIGPSLLKQGGLSLYIQSPLNKRKKKETGYITLIISYASGFLT